MGAGKVRLHGCDPCKTPYTQHNVVCKNRPFDLTSTVGLMFARRPAVASLVLLPLLLCWSYAQSPSGAAPLTIDGVVKLTGEKVSEDLIAALIRKNAKAFDLSSDEILELKRLGVTESIIKLLIDPTQPYLPPPRPEPPPAPVAKPVVVPSKKYPADPNAAKVPPEPGIYRFQRNAPVAVDIKLFLGQKQGAGVGKLLLKKGRVIGYLVGPASKNRLADVTPVFYFRAADGKGTEEMLLVALDQKKDRRELDLGPPAPKPEFNSDTIRQFDSLEVGPGLFRLTASALRKGEYAFFLMNTADPAKGNYGKGFDFAVDPPASAVKR
jgi:hypothetical protein